MYEHNIKHFLSLCNIRIATDLNLAALKTPLLVTSKYSANTLRSDFLSRAWNKHESPGKYNNMCKGVEERFSLGKQKENYFALCLKGSGEGGKINSPPSSPYPSVQEPYQGENIAQLKLQYCSALSFPKH